MPYNMIMLYFRFPYFHVSYVALFSTLYFSNLILYRRRLDTLYLKQLHGKRFRILSNFKNISIFVKIFEKSPFLGKFVKNMEIQRFFFI